MQSSTTPDQDQKATLPAPTRTETVEPDFSGTPQPIGEFTERDDFPRCALGAYIDIRGFAGVVVEIIKGSIKVRSSEGITQRFNANRLKTLYAPPDRSTPVPPPSLDRPRLESAPEPGRATPEAPPRVHIADPDFAAPVRPINDYASQPGFPQSAFGKHVDILGYTGVVVEIVKGSLKIQSPTGITRSYNSETLRKLYGNG